MNRSDAVADNKRVRAPRAGQGADEGYSLRNAVAFGWNSISGSLIPDRVQLLEKYAVGRSVLDAGCGGGGFVDHLVEHGFEATGLDKHAMFLAVARERGFRGAFVQADLASPLPFADGSFDTTICFDVLEHVADDAQTLRELARITERRLILAVPQEDRWMPNYRLSFYPYRDPTHVRYYTPESLRALAESVCIESAQVFGEQRILLRELASDLIHPRSRYPCLSRVYQRVFDFLVARGHESTLYMNLAAVIDLRPSTRRR